MSNRLQDEADNGLLESRSKKPHMHTRTRLFFIVVVIMLAVVGSVAVLFAVDLYLHRKFERTAGVNIWGYRGPAVSRKHLGEYRIAILGGSAAFGYGVVWQESMPARLEQKLRAALPSQEFSVMNLGYNNEGGYSLRFTLEDYDYLKYDLACLYDGYNDVAITMNGGQNLSVFRHDSPIFRLTAISRSHR